MELIQKVLFFGCSTILTLASPALAGSESALIAQGGPMVNRVSELRDVSPGDWAFEALRNLTERYGCVRSDLNGRYRGNQKMTRFEFAVGLSDCLQKIEDLIESADLGGVSREDLEAVRRLSREFQAELAILGTRVDNLEERVATLEDNQFSTTTKLQGEAVFALSGVTGGEGLDIDDNQMVLQNRVRLAFVTSFTGKDSLYTRLDAGNAKTFDNLDQGAFTFNFDNGNNVEIGWIAYYFPIGDKIQVYLPAAFPLYLDFVPTVSPYLEGFTGATAALSSYAESSPIYKIGLAAGGGIGFNYELLDTLMLSAGYFGGNSFDASNGNGLFNGEYSALGQVTWTPTDKFQIAATYVNAYFNDFEGGNTIFDLGVGTNNAKAPFGDGPGVTAITNSYGIQASYQFSTKVALNAYGGYTTARQTSGGSGDAQIWYYGVGLALPDLGKEGNLAGIVVGSEPYVGEEDDVALHIEGFYKYQLNDNISVTPGVIWINAPDGDTDNNGAFIGTIRTTFTF